MKGKFSMDIANRIITKDMIKQVYEKGVAYLLVKFGCLSFHMPDGGMEDSFFYFAGYEDETLTPEEYLKIHTLDELIENVYTTLEEFRTSGDEFLMEEYLMYYDSVLKQLDEKIVDENTAHNNIINLNLIAHKYGFSTECHRNGTHLTEILFYTPNVYGNLTYWFRYKALYDLFIGNNTEKTHIWLWITRPDLTANKLVAFFKEILNTLKSVNSNDESDKENRMLLQSYVSPKDWEMLSKCSDAFQDRRYTEMETLL
jgi:hypothetical protein